MVVTEGKYALYITLLSYCVFSFHSRKRTPLIEAAGKGHINIVRFLLENGADVNGKKEVRYKHKLYMLYIVKSEFESSIFYGS